MKRILQLILISSLAFFYQCESDEEEKRNIIEESPLYEENSPEESPDKTTNADIDISNIIANDIIGKRIVEIAEHEIGRGPDEVGQDRTEYPLLLNQYMPAGDAWCSEFVSWTYLAAGWPLTGGGYGGWMQNTHLKLRDWFVINTDEGNWYSKESDDWNIFPPKPGDYIRFIWTSNGNGHSGIVKSVSGTTMHTIEGNYSNLVKERVIYNWRSNKDINGIGSRKIFKNIDLHGAIVKIKSKESGKYLKIKNSSNFVYQDEDSDDASVKWEITCNDFGFYKIKNLDNGLYLDVNENSSYLRVFNDNGMQDKQWIITDDGLGNYNIRNVIGKSFYIDVNKDDNFVRVYKQNYKVDKYWEIIVL